MLLEKRTTDRRHDAIKFYFWGGGDFCRQCVAIAAHQATHLISFAQLFRNVEPGHLISDRFCFLFASVIVRIVVFTPRCFVEFLCPRIIVVRPFKRSSCLARDWTTDNIRSAIRNGSRTKELTIALLVLP